MERVTVTAPPAQVIGRLLAVDAHADDIADMALALVGWDAAVQALAASRNPRSGEVLLAILAAALLDDL